MAKFKVIGECVVGGVEPGGVVELDLPDDCIDALVRCGNIEPVKATKAGSAVRPKEYELVRVDPKGGE